MTGPVSETRLLAPLSFAALLGVTLLALVLVERVRDEPRLVDNVTVRPVEFSPGVQTDATLPAEVVLRFRLTVDESQMTVEVVDSDGRPVTTVARGRSLGDYRFYDFRWDGTVSGGGTAPPGQYRFRLLLGDAERGITIDEPTTLVRSAGPDGEE